MFLGNPYKKYSVSAKEWQRGFEDGKREILEERKIELELKIIRVQEKVALQLYGIGFNLTQNSKSTFLSVEYLKKCLKILINKFLKNLPNKNGRFFLSNYYAHTTLPLGQR